MEASLDRDEKEAALTGTYKSLWAIWRVVSKLDFLTIHLCAAEQNQLNIWPQCDGNVAVLILLSGV